MKALVYRGPKSLGLEEVPRPAPAEQEVLVRVAATGICGSDVHGYLGLTGRRIPPLIMGHEFCGTVEELGRGVEGVRAGDRVVIEPVISCGACTFCRRGRTDLCSARRCFGVMKLDGSMAELVAVPARLLHRMPDGLSPAMGAMVEPVAVAHRAVSRVGNLIGGSTVLVVGAGTIGLLLLALARLHGPRRVLVSDLNERRLALARSLGADVVLHPSRGEIVDAVREHTDGEGVDVSFEAVGASATVEQALACLRPRGTCVWVGNSQREIRLDMQRAVTRELNVLGSYVYTAEQFDEAIGFLARREIDVEPIVSCRAPLTRGPELFAALSEPDTDLVKVVLEG